jgi:hypothetical protein
MMTRSNISKLAVVLMTFFAGTFIASKPVKSQENPSYGNQNLSRSQKTIAALGNGNYQFCTEAEPKEDWRVGAGGCFNFSKVGDRIDGYYGYPHSGDFICIRGRTDGNRIIGNALVTLWGNSSSREIPQSEFKWDEEGHLTLSQGKLLRSTKTEDGRIDWISFDKATLNTQGFYLYSSPRMTPSSQLCKW